MLAGEGLVHGLVFEHPGEVVGDEDGVEASGERGVDVGLGAIADHPGHVGLELVVAGEQAVGGAGLLGEDFHGRKVFRQSRPAELVALLQLIALGDQDALVARGQRGKGLGDAGEQLDLLVGDGLREAGDAGAFLRRDGAVGELLEAGDQRLAEAAQTVAVRLDGGRPRSAARMARRPAPSSRTAPLRSTTSTSSATLSATLLEMVPPATA